VEERIIGKKGRKESSERILVENHHHFEAAREGTASRQLKIEALKMKTEKQKCFRKYLK
jgi:hypothetical protein